MTKLKDNRGIISYVLLTIITCGIYALYFIWKMSADMNDLCKEDGRTTPGLAKYILLGIITCGIYNIIWWYRVAERLNDAGARKNVKVDINGTNFLLFYIIGAFVCGIGALVALHLVFTSMNRLAAAYNAELEANPFTAA